MPAISVTTFWTATWLADHPKAAARNATGRAVAPSNATAGIRAADARPFKGGAGGQAKREHDAGDWKWHGPAAS